jgi:hypothetical protein
MSLSNEFVPVNAVIVNCLPPVFDKKYVSEIEQLIDLKVGHDRPSYRRDNCTVSERAESLVSHLKYPTSKLLSSVYIIPPMDSVLAAAFVIKMKEKYGVYPILVHMVVTDPQLLTMKVESICNLNEDIPTSTAR